MPSESELSGVSSSLTPALQNNVVVPGILEQEGAEITEHFPSVSSVSSCSTSYREHV